MRNRVQDEKRQRRIRRQMAKCVRPAMDKEFIELNEKLVVLRHDSGDDRKELEDKDVERRMRGVARSVCAVMPVARLERRQDLSWALAAPTLIDRYNVAPTEPFATQPTAAIGTGFLVKRNLIATALHVATHASSPEDLCFVFDYKVVRGKTKTLFDRKDVYFGKSIVWCHLPSDIALVEVTEPVQRRRTLDIQWRGIRDRQSVYVVGYPIGLPAKVADNASVLKNRRRGPKSEFFTADLDAMTFNSGSPVFRSDSHRVVGIISQAPFGFESVNGQLVSRFMQSDDDIVISRISNLLRTQLFR